MMAMNSDEIEEIKKAAFARWEAEAAAESERRKQEGKVSIWLERADDDGGTFTKDRQIELHAVVKAIRDEGIELEAPFMAVDGVDAVGGYTGQLIISLAVIHAPIIAHVLVAWIKEKAKSKVGVEFYSNGQIKKVWGQTDQQVLEIVEAVRKTEPPSLKKKNK